MVNTLRFHPLVSEDLKAAMSWYDGVGPDLGNRFREAVEVRFDSIEAYPESYGRLVDQLRAARIAGFPYLVIFEFNSKSTESLAYSTPLRTLQSGRLAGVDLPLQTESRYSGRDDTRHQRRNAQASESMSPHGLREKAPARRPYLKPCTGADSAVDAPDDKTETALKPVF
jgi:hypothetical protein